MDTFLENARRIFDVARAGACGIDEDFALLVRPDGGLHFIMEAPFSIEGAAAHVGAATAYRVRRSRDGVRVEGRTSGGDCVLQERKRPTELLRDQPRYCITSPV